MEIILIVVREQDLIGIIGKVVQMINVYGEQTLQLYIFFLTQLWATECCCNSSTDVSALDKHLLTTELAGTNSVIVLRLIKNV